jgi:hypothetical protein
MQNGASEEEACRAAAESVPVLRKLVVHVLACIDLPEAMSKAYKASLWGCFRNGSRHSKGCLESI